MVERFQIYQLTFPSIPAGGLIGVPLQLDTDAPFALRRVKSRGIGLNGWRFQTPKKAYQSNFLRTDWAVPVVAGESPYPTRGTPIYPQFIYPSGAQLVCDVGNETGETITNGRLVFFGAKLFENSALSAPTYPPKISPLPFVYPMFGGPVEVPIAAGATTPTVLRDLQLKIDQDADFVYRYGVCDPFVIGVEGGVVPPPGDGTQANWSDLRVMVRDESRKAYMNEPIALNDWFGQSLPNPNGAGADDQGVGPGFPGMPVPEIYLEREHSLYFDLFRYDTSGATVTLNFRFGGDKVFRR